MKIWPVHDGKARFSELLKVCLLAGPQIVAQRGVEVPFLSADSGVAAIAPICPRPTLKELLLADTPRAKLLLPSRGGRRRRQLKPPARDVFLLDTGTLSPLAGI